MSYKYAIYSRKSRFTGKGESIENQIELCREYIRKTFDNADPEDIIIYEDEGFSGKNTERPRFQQMMRDAKKKCFSFIICYRLDRISRNIGDFAKLIEELNSMGISFISIKEQFDTSSPMGRAMMYIASVFSQLERETIAERIRDNMLELAKTGRWLGGTTPTGYESERAEFITVEGRTKRLFQLTVIPQEADLVTVIFHKYLEVQSLSKLETYLMLHGYKTKNNKNFTRFALKGILSNPVYMRADRAAYQFFNERQVEIYSPADDFDGNRGMSVYNRTLQSNGKNTIIRPIHEWIVCVGKHTGLVSGKEWCKVQQLLEKNNSLKIHRSKNHRALLSGLLLCGNCGNYMRPKSFHRSGTNEDRGFYYLCSMKEKSRGQICNMKNPNGTMLDDLICMELDRLSCNYELLYIQLKEEIHGLELKNVTNDINRLRKQIREKDKEVKKLLNTLMKADNPDTEEYIMKHIEEERERKKAMERQLEELVATIADGQQQEEDCDWYQQALRIVSGSMEELTLDQRRSVIRSVINKVIWDGDNVHLYLLPTAPQMQDSK